MTPEQGQHLAAIAAAGIFVVGVTSMLLWRLEARITRRHNAPRFEPRRFALVAEDPTWHEEEAWAERAWDEIVAGWDDEVTEELSLRAEHIQIPREGEPS